MFERVVRANLEWPPHGTWEVLQLRAETKRLAKQSSTSAAAVGDPVLAAPKHPKP